MQQAMQINLMMRIDIAVSTVHQAEVLGKCTLSVVVLLIIICHNSINISEQGIKSIGNKNSNTIIRKIKTSVVRISGHCIYKLFMQKNNSMEVYCTKEHML